MIWQSLHHIEMTLHRVSNAKTMTVNPIQVPDYLELL